MPAVPRANLVVSVLLSVCYMTGQSPGSSESVEALLDRHLQFLGGKAAMEAVRTRRSTGWMERNQVQVPLVQSQRAPNRMMVELRFPRPGTLRRGFDGKGAWVDHPTSGAHPLLGAEADALAGAAWLHPILHLRERYPLRRRVGDRLVEGRAALGIEMATGPGARPETWWFEAASARLLQIDKVWDGGAQGEVSLCIQFDDERRVGSLRLPFRIRTRLGHQESVTQWETIEQNLDLPETLFRQRP